MFARSPVDAWNALKEKGHRETLEIFPLQEAPLSLGGEYEDDFVATNTGAYCSLERSKSPPTPSRATRVKDTQSKKAFLQYCHGNFIVEMRTNAQNDKRYENDQNIVALCLVARLDQNDTDFNMLVYVKWCCSEGDADSMGFIQSSLPTKSKFVLSKHE